AVPAYAGIPVTHRKIAASFAIVTGHEDPTRGSSSINWAQLATATDTLLFLMGVERLDEIAGELIRHGRAATTPVAVVEWGTHTRQRTVVGVLEDIAGRCKEEGVKPPAVTIVGEVVALRDQLRWFDRKPLFGKRALVTRARDQVSDLARLLTEGGAEVLEYPTIRIRPFQLDETPAFHETLSAAHDWIIFTSVNAVECFFGLVRGAGGDARSIGAAKIAAVGPVTAGAVERAGLRVDFIPQEAMGERIAATFPEPVSGLRLLIPRALVAPEELPAAFRSAGASVTVLPVYETVPDEGGAAVRESLLAGEVDWITFTSSSTVKNFLKDIAAPDVPAATKIACIGPMTSETAQSAGLRVDVMAAEHTVPGLVAAILEYSVKESS
ncbi:MAG: uroporphyrinogen-III synthase, partial [Armatimonadota bacterium]|nr:uroporphyrinogen-III synthase [Armatimonadota bacterium]